MKVPSRKITSSANFDHFSKLEIFLISAKKPLIQVRKRHFFKKISYDTHSTANLPALPILRKKIMFLAIFQKSNFVRFEKSYYFSRIQRQIRYNLVMRNFHNQNRRISDTFTHQTSSIGKNVGFQRFEWMIVLPYYKYGWKIITKRRITDHKISLYRKKEKIFYFRCLYNLLTPHYITAIKNFLSAI